MFLVGHTVFEQFRLVLAKFMALFDKIDTYPSFVLTENSVGSMPANLKSKSGHLWSVQPLTNLG